MAADTAAKRFSAMNMGSPWRGLNVMPDATIPQGERQAAMYWYSGILFLIPTPPIIVAVEAFSLGSQAARYNVMMGDTYGRNAIPLNDLVSFELSRQVNGVGYLSIVLPDYRPFDTWKWLNRIAIHRSLGGPEALEGETLWLLMDWHRILTPANEELVELECFDLNWLLGSRGVANFAGTPYTDKTDNAGDIMKAIVREQLGSLASDTSRDLSAYLNVQADLGDGASLTKQFAWRNSVLTVLQDLAQTSAERGEYLAFDVTATALDGAFSFQTYPQQRGVDRRGLITFTPPAISDIRVSQIHSKERTFAYALGKDELTARRIQTASDAARMALSPFARVESLLQASNVGSAAALLATAQGGVRDGRPYTAFSCRLNDTDSLRFRVHYNFGDFANAEYKNELHECRLDAYAINFERDSGEEVNAALRAETSLEA